MDEYIYIVINAIVIYKTKKIEKKLKKLLTMCVPDDIIYKSPR